MIAGVLVQPMDDGSRSFVLAYLKQTLANRMDQAWRDAIWPVLHAGVEPWLEHCEVRVLVSPGDPDVFHGFAVDYDGKRAVTVIKPRYMAMSDALVDMLDAGGEH